MDISTQLRLILLVCGVALLVGMYVFGRIKRAQPGSYKAQRFDPHSVDDNDDELVDDDAILDEDTQGELIIADEVVHIDDASSRQPMKPAMKVERQRIEPIVFSEAIISEPELEDVPETALPEEDEPTNDPVIRSTAEPARDWRDEVIAARTAHPDPAPWTADESVIHHAEVRIDDEATTAVLTTTPRMEPTLGDVDALNVDDAHNVVEPTPVTRPEAPTLSEEVKPAPQPARPAAASTRPKPTGTATRKIMALRLAFTPEKLAGDRLKSLLEGERLQIGKFNIFHRLHDGASVFSVASMVEPGTFDPHTMAQQQYAGITLFAMLPGALEAPQVFDQLLNCAQHLAQATQGILQDERGSKLTPYLIERMRDEALDFQHLVGGVSAEPVG